jgi:hypothetical protein
VGDWKVVVTITPGKESIYQYVLKRLKLFRVKLVYFNDSFFEWPGSVFSAKENFAAKNIVLLPDSFIGVRRKHVLTCRDGRGLIQMAADSLDKNEVSFGYVLEESAGKLAKLGALRVVDGRILEFQDKPAGQFDHYNGYWASYCFRKEAAGELYDFMVDSVKHGNFKYKDANFYPAGGFELDCYHDLGTWTNINDFRKKYENETFVKS